MKSSWDREQSAFYRRRKIQRRVLGVLVIIVIVPLLMWGTISLGTIIMYNFFYEGMVIETIQEMVKESLLKGGT